MVSSTANNIQLDRFLSGNKKEHHAVSGYRISHVYRLLPLAKAAFLKIGSYIAMILPPSIRQFSSSSHRSFQEIISLSGS